MMKKIVLFMVSVFVISNYTLGQNHHITLDKDLDGNTILEVSIPQTIFHINCDGSYRCIVGCDVCFQTDEQSRWQLDSFSIEKVYINLISDEAGKMVFVSNPDGTIDCSSLNGCWTEDVVKDFINNITLSVRNATFKGRSDIVMWTSNLTFHWVEIISEL